MNRRGWYLLAAFVVSLALWLVFAFVWFELGEFVNGRASIF